MFEIVKLILDAIQSVFNPSELIKLRKENKLTEIGATLYLLFIHLNEIVVCGEHILDYLENFQSKAAGALQKGHTEYTFIPFPADTYRLSYISYQISEQRLNLAKFGSAVADLAIEFQVLAPKEYRELTQLIGEKSNSLHSLLCALGHGYLPLDDLQEDTKHEMWGGGLKKLKEDKIVPCTPDVVWDIDLYKRIKKCFERENPRQQIKNIENLLERLRSILEAHFSTKELLLKVRDKRFTAKRYDGSQFVHFAVGDRGFGDDWLGRRTPRKSKLQADEE